MIYIRQFLITNEILLYNHICHLQKYPRGLVFYYDEEGHLVAKENSFMTKKDKKPDFETPDKELYYEWVDKKVKEGYTVTTVYDEKKTRLIAVGYL